MPIGVWQLRKSREHQKCVPMDAFVVSGWTGDVRGAVVVVV